MRVFQTTYKTHMENPVIALPSSGHALICYCRPRTEWLGPDVYVVANKWLEYGEFMRLLGSSLEEHGVVVGITPNKPKCVYEVNILSKEPVEELVVEDRRIPLRELSAQPVVVVRLGRRRTLKWALEDMKPGPCRGCERFHPFPKICLGGRG